MKQKDKGAVLIFTVTDNGKVVDLSEAEKASLIIKSGGVVTTKNCTFHDRANGKIKYVVKEGDLDLAGTIHFEVEIKFDEGRRFTSRRITDYIEEKL